MLSRQGRTIGTKRATAMDTTRISLLERLRDAEDAGAWREFDTRYRDLVLRYCRACGLQAADSEDVHQAVLMSLARSMNGGFVYDRKRGRFRRYLGRAVRNEVIRFHRRRAATPDELAGDCMADDVEDERWEREWQNHHLRLALRALRQRHAPNHMHVFDRLLDGETVEGIAQTSGFSVDAVYKIKQRVRRRLEEQILEQIREEDALER